MAAPRFVHCPRCGKSVEWTPSSRFRPFCSERCKLIDLGAWATEAYRIAVAESPNSGEAEPGEAAGDDAQHS
jgi:uncharacterized protein